MCSIFGYGPSIFHVWKKYRVIANVSTLLHFLWCIKLQFKRMNYIVWCGMQFLYNFVRLHARSKLFVKNVHVQAIYVVASKFIELRSH